MGSSVSVVVGGALALVTGCGAGDNRVDPGDLELRDLLGVSPEAATAWDPAQRAAARRVLVAGLRELEASSRAVGAPAAAAEVDDQVVRLLASADALRITDGAGAVGVVRVAVSAERLAVAARTAPAAAAAVEGRALPGAAASATELWLDERWDAEPAWGNLPGLGLHVLSALAQDAGHPGGALIVVPVPRLAVIAAYIEPIALSRRRSTVPQSRLAVNPVLLAALEPDAGEPDAIALAPRWPEPGRGTQRPAVDDTAITSADGNPYSFYGSVAECAYAQRTRCEACLPGSTCRPVTDASNGNTECEMLAANAGRGYFQLCINLSLAITSVERCTGVAAPACASDPDAADSLTTLDNNADFLSEPACAGALDSCLAEIYGAPDESFPGPDGGPAPSEPPRSTTVSCGNACSNNNANCDSSPSCDFRGPSCDNSLTCNSECSSSNDQSGCDACNSSSDSSGCGSDSGSSGDSCSSSGGDNSSSCGSSSDSSGCSGCSGDSCGSSNCGSSNCGSSNCGSSNCGSSKCSVTQSNAGPGVGLAMSVTWGVLPVPFAALVRRRARRRLLGAAHGSSPASSGEAAS
jgi:uncharacterized membrane protein YgcG